jgi:hypothetical protein
MSDTHTLIVTADAEEPTDSELFGYEIRCPEVTDACRMWVECDRLDCEVRAADEFNEFEYQGHGQRHRYIQDGWMVPDGDACYLIAADEMPDAAAFLVTKEQLGAGEYQIGHDFDDGRIADFQLIDLGRGMTATTT